MADLSGFDAREVPDNSVLPVDVYDAIMIASTMKTNTRGNGRYLEIQFQILNGRHQNWKITDRLNLFNPNETAVNIARRKLADICEAVNVITPNDSSELHNKPLKIKTAVRDDGEYGRQAVITSYSPRHAGPAPVPVTTTKLMTEGPPSW